MTENESKKKPFNEKKFMYRMQKIGKITIFLAFVVNVITTIYFGSYIAPATYAEVVWDYWCGVFFWVGVGIYLFPIMSIYDRLFED